MLLQCSASGSLRFTCIVAHRIWQTIAACASCRRGAGGVRGGPEVPGVMLIPVKFPRNAANLAYTPAAPVWYKRDSCGGGRHAVSGTGDPAAVHRRRCPPRRYCPGHRVGNRAAGVRPGAGHAAGQPPGGGAGDDPRGDHRTVDDGGRGGAHLPGRDRGEAPAPPSRPHHRDRATGHLRADLRSGYPACHLFTATRARRASARSAHCP